MTKIIKLSLRKLRRAIAVAYNTDPEFVPEEIENVFIHYRKAS